MIRLNLQLFAKDASQMKQYRKSKLIEKYKLETESKPKEEEKKQAPSKAHTKGDIVAAVRPDEQYEIFRLVEGKEMAMKDKDGNMITRTGRQVLDKFRYDRRREVWISKDKERRYVIRRKR